MCCLFVTFLSQVLPLQMQSQFTDERLVRMVLKANRSLKHYSDMLTIRGLENIPLASCTEYSKDLLFYIIVDRRRNRVLMPSIVAHGSTVGPLYNHIRNTVDSCLSV